MSDMSDVWSWIYRTIRCAGHRRLELFNRSKAHCQIELNDTAYIYIYIARVLLSFRFCRNSINVNGQLANSMNTTKSIWLVDCFVIIFHWIKWMARQFEAVQFIAWEMVSNGQSVWHVWQNICVWHTNNTCERLNDVTPTVCIFRCTFDCYYHSYRRTIGMHCFVEEITVDAVDLIGFHFPSVHIQLRLWKIPSECLSQKNLEVSRCICVNSSVENYFK